MKKAKEKQPKGSSKIKGFRIDPELQKRLKKVSDRMDLPESWFMKTALEKAMPDFEMMAQQQQQQAA